MDLDLTAPRSQPAFTQTELTKIAASMSPLVIVGMHRSGTSLTAALLQAMGVDVGKNLYLADTNNVKGYFEDVEFLEFQRQVLQTCCDRRDSGWVDWGWTEHETLDPQKFTAYIPQALELIASRQSAIKSPQSLQADQVSNPNSHQFDYVDNSDNSDRSDQTHSTIQTDSLWGWKDPRTTLMLDFWDQLMPRSRYLLVYRSPWDVADSILRLNSHIFSLHPDYALRAWHYYNRHLLDFYTRHRDKCVLMNVNAALRSPLEWLELLRARLGIKINTESAIEKVNAVFDPQIFRSLDLQHPTVQLIAQIYPESVELFAKLDQAADISSNIPDLDNLVIRASADHPGYVEHIDDRLAQINNTGISSRSDSSSSSDNYKPVATKIASEVSAQNDPGDRFQLLKSALLLHLQLLQTQTDKQKIQKELDQLKNQIATESGSKSQKLAPSLEQLQELKELCDRQQQDLAKLAQANSEQAETIANLTNEIAAMKTSKFWKLRQVWFKFKQAIGIKT
jgi:hypothetical protein